MDETNQTTAEQQTVPPKEKKRKKPKARYVDDGHTVYSMDALNGNKKKTDDLGLTRKERWALIRAAFSHYAVPFIIVLAAFAVTGILMYLWLM